MAKKAFCVGINDYPYGGSDLNGYVNDAHAWANLLASPYDFTRSNITLITDAEATRRRILDGVKALPRNRAKHPESKMKEIPISGSTDKEYSYDALIGGVYHGAMTYHALKAIRDSNYHITYSQLQARLQFLLDDAGYPQHPQVEGVTRNKRRPLFT